MTETSNSYESALLAARRFGLAIGYGVRRSPYNDNTEHEPVQGVRPTPLSQWVVHQDDLVAKVTEVYPTLKPGIVKQLMARTSKGKTTKVPCAIAALTRKTVICALPSVPAPERCAVYVANAEAQKFGLVGKVSVLRGADITAARKPGPCVYYTTMGELLSFYAAYPDIIRKLGVDCVVVDESHSMRPEYQVMRWLIAAGKFSDVKVFYMSATATGDLGLEADSGRATVKSDPSELPPAPGNTPHNGPAHYTSIVSRTMLFVADDEDVATWVEYYTNYDVPAVGFGYSSSTGSHVDIDAFLKKHIASVVVVCAPYQSSYTFDIDRVVCLGEDLRMTTDFSEAVVSIQKVPVTNADQMQRAGRAGRIGPGSANVAKVKYSAPVGESDPDLCAYVYLWLRMFNVEVRDENISQFSALFSELSRPAIACLLTLAIPPMLALPYMDNDGVYAQFVPAMAYFSAVRKVPTGATAPPERFGKWRSFEYAVNGDRYEYTARAEFPDKLAVVGHYLWTVAQGDPNDDAVSMAGTHVDPVPLTRRVTGIPKRGRRKSEAPPPSRHLTHRRTSTMTTNSEFGAVDVVFRPGDTGVPVPPVPKRYALKEDVSSTTVIPVRTLESVVEDELPRRDVVSPPPSYKDKPTESDVDLWVKTHSRRSSTSEETVAMRLVKVDPRKKSGAQLYPMQPELLAEFLDSLAVTTIDTSNVKRLLTGESYYATLSPNSTTLKLEQRKYFLSVLRVHRAEISRLLQMSTELPERPRMRFAVRTERTERDATASRIERLAGLLAVCGLEGYEVGVRAKSRHQSSESGSTTGTSVLDEMSRVGALATAYGSREFNTMLQELKGAAIPVFDRRGSMPRYVGNAWHIDDSVLTATHVAEAVDSRDLSLSMPDKYALATDDGDTTVYHTSAVGSKVPVRRPVYGERVGVYGRTAKGADPVLYGYHNAFPVTNNWAFQGKYYAGMSGALVLAYHEPAIVGVYVGRLASEQGVAYSEFAPIPELYDENSLRERFARA